MTWSAIGRRFRRTSARPLAEQHGLRLLVVGEVDGRCDDGLDGKAALDVRARKHRLEPALEMGELLDVLPLPLPAFRPADASDVGDRIGAGEEVTVRESLVHHAIEAI